MASHATEILGPWPAANPAIRSLSHRLQAENVSRHKDDVVGVFAHNFVILMMVQMVKTKMVNSILMVF
jgi:hypothetical protein